MKELGSNLNMGHKSLQDETHDSVHYVLFDRFIGEERYSDCFHGPAYTCTQPDATTPLQATDSRPKASEADSRIIPVARGSMNSVKGSVTRKALPVQVLRDLMNEQ